MLDKFCVCAFAVKPTNDSSNMIMVAMGFTLGFLFKLIFVLALFVALFFYSKVGHSIWNDKLVECS